LFQFYLSQIKNLEKQLTPIHFILPKKKFRTKLHKTDFTYMAQISELAKLPSETALILYWNTIAAFWPAMQQIR